MTTKEVTKFEKAGLPTYLQGTGGNDWDTYAGGVVSGFGIIGYRGKVWRVRIGGEEQAYVNEDGDAVGSVELVLINALPTLSKLYYDKKWSEGDVSRPRCFSTDSVKPDPSVQDPISKSCAVCPNNQWGSRISEEGKKLRACTDSRRVAAVFAHHLAEAVANGTEPEVFLLRIPPASLTGLKDYAKLVLQPKGVPPHAVVTKVGFDPEPAYPKLTFKPQRFLTEEEFELVMKLRESDLTRRVLSEAQDMEAGETTDTATDAPAAAAPAAPAKVATSPASARKLTPAEEEAAGDDEGEEVPPPPPATKPVATKPVATKPVATKPVATKPVPAKATKPAPEPAQEEEEGEGGDDLDAQITALLKG